jgi:hypothetical protein
MRTLLCAAAAAVLLLALAAGALAYPKTLFDAVSQIYAPKKTHIDGLCHEKIGHSVYARVDVTLVKSDAQRRAAFQYVRGGWRALSKDGSLLRSVPKSQRAHFRWILRELKRFCGE